MSIQVALEKLRVETARLGPTPYFLSVSDDGRPHAVLVTYEWLGDVIVLKAGKRSAANAATRPLVSLLWTPVAIGEYSLIVDGEASASGSGESMRISIRPTRGVLHRLATTPAIATEGCSADCMPILN